MKLILFHPQILQRTCASCQAWLYDDEHRPLVRAGLPVARPSGGPAPCWKCPKQSPAQARGLERDLVRISRTLELYFQVRATGGRCLSDRAARDAVVARHLAIVDAIVRPWEASRAAAALKRGSRLC